MGLRIHEGHGYIRRRMWSSSSATLASVRSGRGQRYPGSGPGRPQLGLHNGRLLRRFFHPVAAYLESRQTDAVWVGSSRRSPKLRRTSRRPRRIAQQGMRDPTSLGIASDYLSLFALSLSGTCGCRCGISLARFVSARPRPGPGRPRVGTGRRGRRPNDGAARRRKRPRQPRRRGRRRQSGKTVDLHAVGPAVGAAVTAAMCRGEPIRDLVFLSQEAGDRRILSRSGAGEFVALRAIMAGAAT